MSTKETDLPPVFTIGHSTHSFVEFASMLEQEEIACIVDVRKLTGSRRFPQFNDDALVPALKERGMAYVHIAALGGRRGRSLAKSEPSPNDYWTNTSFRRYADYALTPEFAQGMDELQVISQRERCALMCAEAVWWRCHRRIIADYLLMAGREVRHIIGKARAASATLTPGAQISTWPNSPGRQVLTYPAPPNA